MNDLDQRIRSALAARAAQVTEADLRPEPLPAADRPAFLRRASRPWLPPLLAAAAVAVLATGTIAVVKVATSGHHAPPGHSPAPTAPAPTLPTHETAPTETAPTETAPTETAPTKPAPTSTAPSKPRASKAPAPPATPTEGSGTPAPFELGYQPLWPFATLADAKAWKAAYTSGGHQPWHLDAGETALAFTRGYLGFLEIDRVMSTRMDADGAHIGVGDLLPENHPITVAVLHLVRFGTDATSPWEVVGSDDTTFSLETPAYGSVITSPVTVGGHVSTVEPSIHVWVRQVSSEAPLGERCCIAAEAGADMPWSGTVSFSGATDPVLTIVASEGGMAQGVERFAIQGVRSE